MFGTVVSIRGGVNNGEKGISVVLALTFVLVGVSPASIQALATPSPQSGVAVGVAKAKAYSDPVTDPKWCYKQWKDITDATGLTVKRVKKIYAAWVAIALFPNKISVPKFIKYCAKIVKIVKK